MTVEDPTEEGIDHDDPTYLESVGESYSNKQLPSSHYPLWTSWVPSKVFLW